MRWIVLTLSLFLFLLLIFVAAQRSPVRSASNARLTIQIQHVFDGVPLRLNDPTLMTGAGNRVSISRLAYLVSNVTLTRADGTKVPLGGQFAYFNPAESRTAFTLSEVPPGEYIGLSFQIGLDPAQNHRDPALYPAGHPLNPLVNRLHWGWQGGYVFLALEGRYALPNQSLGGYSCHLATDKNLMTVTLPCHLNFSEDGALGLQFDVAKVFDGVHRIALSPKDNGDATHSALGELAGGSTSGQRGTRFFRSKPDIGRSSHCASCYSKDRLPGGNDAVPFPCPGQLSPARFAA